MPASDAAEPGTDLISYFQSSMKRAAAIVGLLAALAAISWFFPLVHVVRLGESKDDKSPAAFDAATFAKSFWTDKLLPSRDQAADAATVLAALRENPQHAREQFGRSVGVSRATLFYLRGEGTVVDVEKGGIGIVVGGNDQPNIVLRTGPLFGNTVRDATGLLDAGAFSNSQQFNELSTELNRIVETEVFPELTNGTKPGGKIQFLACVELTAEPNPNKPLVAVPLEVSFP